MTNETLFDCNGAPVDPEANPLMARFLSRTDWGPNDWDIMLAAKRRWAYGLLTEQALRKIAAFAPLVELGAGTGYWAEQLERLFGIAIMAYDICPLAAPDFGSHRQRGENGWHSGTAGKGYFYVFRGDEKVLSHSPGSTLMLMFPPKEEEYPLGYEALRHYQGEHFIYVGEPEFLGAGKVIAFDSDGVKYSTDETRGRTGTPAFHQELRDHWELVETEPLPNWPDLHAALFIYRRKK